MNPRLTREMVFAGAVLLGILADQLLSVSGRPGLNAGLWAIAGAAVLYFLARRRSAEIARESRWLVAAAVGFALLMMLRDAESLGVLCLFSVIALMGLAAGHGANAWAVRAQIPEIAAAAIRVGILIASGPLGWALTDTQHQVPTTRSERPRRVRVVARGTIMALPPLLVLTALLTSADPVFANVLHAALVDSFEPLLEHLAFAGVIAWLASGYLRAFLISDAAVLDHAKLPRPAIAASEITVALGLLNVLFIAFLVVQVRYLFGGANLVEVTERLSYAEYARRGFFELVAAAALVVPVLLAADWAGADDDARGRRIQRATSTLLVVLLVGVLASAAYRMWLYQGAYGLTEDRLYVTMILVWLTGVLAWLSMTVLRGKRRGFAFGAIAGGLACIAGMHVVNPHATIARVNISRAAAGAQFDSAYLQTLSADAVPTLIDRLHEMSPADRCLVSAMVQKRWGGERPGGWRTWNLSDARARSIVSKQRMPAECSVRG